MSNTCYVCLEKLNNKSVETGCNCNQKLHKKCLKTMIDNKNTTCSICKTDFSCNALSKCFKSKELINILTNNRKPKIPNDCVLLNNIVIDIHRTPCGCVFVETSRLFAKHIQNLEIMEDASNNVFVYCGKQEYYNYINEVDKYNNNNDMQHYHKKQLNKPTKNFKTKPQRICTHYRR